MSTIALFGAAGAIGRSIAAALRAEGRAYRVVGRSREALQAAFGDDPQAEIVTWNPEDPASVRQAAQGMETVVYMVGVDYWRFDLHPRLVQQALDGAVAACVKQFLLIGTVYPYGRPRSRPVREDHPREPHTFKGRMRLAQEERVLAAHARGDIRSCVLRLPDFYGPGVDKSFLHSAFQAAVHGGTARLVGPLEVPHEFVYVPDVGPVVTRLAAAPGAWGRWWHLAGAGATSQLALLQEIERQQGRPLKRKVAGKTLLRLAGLFNPFLREMVEMHYLVTDPVILDDRALQALLGPLPKTPYAEGVRQTLASVRAQVPQRGTAPA
ncbi:NAD-dependent epimerase/dehydratase family protein [Eleftheria terrae]|uniref:NAD-dependent epimerase/dehydratase family protein n=1 Tax=Eleftheria terrae TaxID=1597781 RepID=UPI00263BB9AD|nr:NAD-dependent epimerase/dehydratase family protein [Eleftheria terrae]WKB52224.1 NAD-dependent epimerase/dehydratase family protein [Eleftheria terrae]